MTRPKEQRPSAAQAYHIARGHSGRRIDRPEQAIQRNIAEWLRLQHKGLLWFHIPNGGGRSRAEAGILYAMGVRPGVADLCFVLYGRNAWVEIKGPDGRVDKLQEEFRDAVVARGDEWHLVRSLDDMTRLVAEWRDRGLLAPPQPTEARSPAVPEGVLRATMGEDAIALAEEMERGRFLERRNRLEAEAHELKGDSRAAADSRSQERKHAARADEAERRLRELLSDGARIQRLDDGRVLILARICGRSIRREHQPTEKVFVVGPGGAGP
jgi:hypothetical protein